MKLYLYEHCIYCLRPRIIIGLNKINIKSFYLANDNEKDLISKSGKKQVPLLEKNGLYFLESLEICKILGGKEILENNNSQCNIRSLVVELYDMSKALIYPRFLYHPQNSVDFPTEKAKNYFLSKKEKSIGSFERNLKLSTNFARIIKPLIKDIDKLIGHSLSKKYMISWNDLYIFPVLRSLTIAQDVLEIPNNIFNYVNLVCDIADIKIYKYFKF